jgi:hypothetical protein
VNFNFDLNCANSISHLNSRTIFCAWTGTNAISANRLSSLFSVFINSGCPVCFITEKYLKDWQLPTDPFHPAFEYLSETHKADYLRVYLMHHYGGGYTDIKPTHRNWNTFFARLIDSDKFALGYTEIGPQGVAPVGGDTEILLKNNFSQLIGLCAFIFKPKSVLTYEWLAQTDKLLDQKISLLMKHRAQFPQDCLGTRLPNGDTSQYPLRWTELLGDIFHPLIYKYREFIIHDNIAPDFSNYR